MWRGLDLPLSFRPDIRMSDGAFPSFPISEGRAHAPERLNEVQQATV